MLMRREGSLAVGCALLLQLLLARRQHLVLLDRDLVAKGVHASMVMWSRDASHGHVEHVEERWQ